MNKKNKLKVSFSVASKDFKTLETMVLVVESIQNLDDVLYDDIEYKVTIPSYIFDALADTEEQFNTKENHNNTGISGKFKKNRLKWKCFEKTQYSTSIRELIQYIQGISQILLNKYLIMR